MTGAALTLALLGSACGGGDDSGSSDGDNISEMMASSESAGGGSSGGSASGGVRISGSSTVEPISSLNAEKFVEQNPDVQISVDGPGTGDGFQLFCSGETAISDASRPIKDEEIRSCEDNGVEFIELKVAIDGISVLTNPQNDQIDCVSFTDLYALTGPESQGVGDWSEAEPLAEEVAGAVEDAPPVVAAYPDAELTIVGPGEESGTFDTYVEFVVEPIAEARGEDATTRADYTSSPNDNVIVQGISESPTSLGWVGYAFYVENQDQLKALEVADQEGACVAPTDDTIAGGEYPMSRPLFIYVNPAKAEETPAVAEYVDFYLTEAGRESVSEAGYVQLTADQWQATKRIWEERTTGVGATSGDDAEATSEVGSPTTSESSTGSEG